MKGKKPPERSAGKRLVGQARLKPGKRLVGQARLKPVENETDITQGAKKITLTAYLISPWELRTPNANDLIYGKVADDQTIDRLAESIKRRGVLVPLLVNRKGVIASGNRRCVAACHAGMDEVPCFIVDVDEDDPDFVPLLIEANEQRKKNNWTELSEFGIKNVECHPTKWLEMRRLESETQARCGGVAKALDVEKATRKRKGIVRARQLADAAIAAVKAELEETELGATTVRQIHYRILHMTPVPVTDTRTGKKYSSENYDALTDVVARLRVNGEISFDSIIDALRTLYTPQTWANAADYVRGVLDKLEKNYIRDCMRSQNAYYCVLCEKEALGELFRQHVSWKFPGASVAVCRGYGSLSLAHQIHAEFERSGKAHLVLLAFSDCDPDGLEIVDDMMKKLIEVGLDASEFTLARCGLTHDQARKFGAQALPLKEGSKSQKTKAKAFVERTGSSETFELEAIPSKVLLQILDDEMLARMDTDTYFAEASAYRQDVMDIEQFKSNLLAALVPDGVKGREG